MITSHRRKNIDLNDKNENGDDYMNFIFIFSIREIQTNIPYNNKFYQFDPLKIQDKYIIFDKKARQVFEVKKISISKYHTQKVFIKYNVLCSKPLI